MISKRHLLGRIEVNMGKMLLQILVYITLENRLFPKHTGRLEKMGTKKIYDISC